MSLIHAAGNTCAVGELDLHVLPVTQKDILKSVPITKTTNNVLTNTTTSFDFTFKPSNNYTDLSKASLYVEYNVEKPDGTDVTAADEAAPVNNILHSMFANVQMLINGEKLTGNFEQYPYKAYITDLIATEYCDKVTRMAGCQKWVQTQLGRWTLEMPPTAGGSKGGPTPWELRLLDVRFCQKSSQGYWTYNRQRLQNLTSSNCGFHCVRFIIETCRTLDPFTALSAMKSTLTNLTD